MCVGADDRAWSSSSRRWAPSSRPWWSRHSATAVVLHTWGATDWRARQDDVAVRLALPTSGTVQLQLFEGDAATLDEVLALHLPARPLAGEPPPPPRWSVWAVVSVILGAAVVGLFLAMAVPATPIIATVTGGAGDGVCAVTWSEAGKAAHGEVDCADDRSGSVRTIWVLSDEPGDVVDPASLTGGLLAIALLVAAPGVVRLSVVRRRRKAWFESAARVFDDARTTTDG